MRKAQVSTQVFIYIGAAVIAGLILLLGFNAISTVIKTFSQANIDDFKSDFDNKVSVMSKQSGSVDRFDFTLPSKFDEICFADSMNDADKFDIDTASIENGFIRDSIENDAERNVFLLNQQVIEDSFYVEKLDVDTDVRCLENKGKLEVMIKGAGRSALLYIREDE